MLTVNEAKRKINEQIEPVSGSEQVPLKECVGRILVDNLYATQNIPSEAISAMDGYAVKYSEIANLQPKQLQIVGTSWAGSPYTGTHKEGECIRIFTGAVLPEWSDSVILQENVEQSEKFMSFSGTIAYEDYVRGVGSDIETGQIVFEKGHRISAADIGLIASLGLGDLCVQRKLRAAFFSTGDELRPLNTPLKSGEIYDSNRYSIHALLSPLNIQALDLGVIKDNLELLCNTLQNTAAENDVIISSGGVSVGDADYTKEALQQVGQINFWKIAMKPGKPLAFGRIGNCWFFGLPGNPVSVLVTFYQIIRPALLKLSGATEKKSLHLNARCDTDINRTPGRQEFQRGSCFINDAGVLMVTPATKQESHNLSVLNKTNCFIILPADCNSIKAGETVEIEPIEAPYTFC